MIKNKQFATVLFNFTKLLCLTIFPLFGKSQWHDNIIEQRFHVRKQNLNDKTVCTVTRNTLLRLAVYLPKFLRPVKDKREIFF